MPSQGVQTCTDFWVHYTQITKFKMIYFVYSSVSEIGTYGEMYSQFLLQEDDHRYQLI